jgi:hypothetical protein
MRRQRVRFGEPVKVFKRSTMRLVEAVLVKDERHLVDGAHVGRADDAVLVDVAEERRSST